jgi:hypothetical protein
MKLYNAQLLALLLLVPAAVEGCFRGVHGSTDSGKNHNQGKEVHFMNGTTATKERNLRAA